MSAAITLNGMNNFGETAGRPESIEEKALDFFRRADSGMAPETVPAITYAGGSATRTENLEEKALDFFRRAELSVALENIWATVKRQRFGTMIRLVKAVAAITAVVLLSQSLSFAGLLALAGTIAGLLFTAITNTVVWLLYIPMYFYNVSDFSTSIMLAIGLAWLAGVSPFVALIISPFVLVGSRLFGRTPVAQARVAALPEAIGTALDGVNLGATLQQAAGNAASAVGRFAKGIGQAALLAGGVPAPIIARSGREVDLCLGGSPGRPYCRRRSASCD